MNLLQITFSSVILLAGLSGCASTGYSRSYVDYSAGYSEPVYYEYPVQSYYQATPMIIYEQHFQRPRHPHGHGDSDHRHWDNSPNHHNHSHYVSRNRDDNKAHTFRHDDRAHEPRYPRGHSEIRPRNEDEHHRHPHH